MPPSMLIVFAYKKAVVEISHSGPGARKPPPDVRRISRVIDPDPHSPEVRIYLSKFYDLAANVVLKDLMRPEPVIDTNVMFHSFHAKSLEASPVPVGRRLTQELLTLSAIYLGPSCAPLDHGRTVDLCRSLSWRFAIHGDD